MGDAGRAARVSRSHGRKLREIRDPGGGCLRCAGRLRSTLTVSALFHHALGDIDLFLRPDSGCGAVVPLASGTSVTDDEVLQWHNQTGLPTVVTLEVRIASGSSGDCNEYDLVVAPGPGTAIGSSYCGPAANNATGQPGALLVSGSELASSNDVTLAAYQLPGSVTGYFMASRNQGFVAMPGGSFGNLCLGGAIGRYVGSGQIQNAGSAGVFSLALDLTMVPTPTSFVAVQPGDTLNFQAWFRDSFVGVPTSNFTDAVSVTFL